MRETRGTFEGHLGGLGTRDQAQERLPALPGLTCSRPAQAASLLLRPHPTPAYGSSACLPPWTRTSEDWTQVRSAFVTPGPGTKGKLQKRGCKGPSPCATLLPLCGRQPAPGPSPRATGMEGPPPPPGEVHGGLRSSLTLSSHKLSFCVYLVPRTQRKRHEDRRPPRACPFNFITCLGEKQRCPVLYELTC